MKKNNGTSQPLPFRTENAFKRKFLNYIEMCSAAEESDGKHQKRIANSAGFCAYCSITGDEFRQLKAAYPRAFDIMQSHFIDAAVNNKLLNSGPVMDYLLNSINLLGRDTDASDISVVLDDELAGDAE